VSCNRFLTILAMVMPLVAPCAVLAASQGSIQGMIELAQTPPPKQVDQFAPKDAPPSEKAPVVKKAPPPPKKGAPPAPKIVVPPKVIAPKAPPPPPAAKKLELRTLPPKAPPPPPKDSFKKAPQTTVVPPKIAPGTKAPPVEANPAIKGRTIAPVAPKVVKEAPGSLPKDKFGIAPNLKVVPKQPTAVTKQPGPVVPGRKIEASKRPPPPKPPQVKDLVQLKGERKQRTELGGKRIIIEEPDRRRIITEDGRTFIRHDESDRFQRQWRDTRYERRGGLDLSVTLLPGGFYLYTEFDSDRRPLRRYRRGPDGRDIILFDNRAFYRRHRGPDWYRYTYVELPPPVIRIPRREYIVEYEDASPDFIYDTLYAPPIEDVDRRYSLEEIRYSPSLRDRMRRVDLSSINFEFGSWEIDPSQYRKLERVADAMNRIIQQDSSEMFMVEGYTDAVGEAEDNLTLSDRRAESVAIILTQEFGVPSENMTTQGYGEQHLKIATDGEEPRNRYVAVRRVTPILER